MESIVESHHGGEHRGSCRGNHAPCIGDRRRERLLDVYVLAALERGDRHIGMECRRQRDDDSVHVLHRENVRGVASCPRSAHDRLRCREIRRVMIGNGNHGRICDPRQRRQMCGTSNAAAPENADPNGHAVRYCMSFRATPWSGRLQQQQDAELAE